MNTITLGGIPVGPSHPPFVIAEMSGNHNQDLDQALALVDAAANAGVQALKLQTYTADTMTLDLDVDDFVIRDPGNLWQGQSLYHLYERAHTPWEWHAPIFAHARSRGLVVFSSPFDASAVDFLETLEVPCYKIASFENGDLPLIRKVAATGKPLLISTGTAEEEEITEAVNTARAAGARELILLKCTSCYPADPAEANLRTLTTFRERFDCLPGLSDHTPGSAVAVAAVACGACVIEKHLTLSRDNGGVDAAFSLEPDEFATLVHDVNMAWQSLGRISFHLSGREKQSRARRRSLYVVKDIEAGERFTPDHIRAIRPGAGLPPKHLEDVLGKKATQSAKRGTPLNWALVDPVENRTPVGS